MRSSFLRSGAAAVAAATALSVAIPAVGQEAPDPLDPAYHAAIDDALVHGTVTPPGAQLEEKEKELRAYDDLVQGYPTLTAEELTTKYFKDGLFGPIEDVDREYFPRADVRIVRDAQWGVPHIYGETDEAMAFGAGYASAEDRLPIMELLRALGRAEAFELLGDNASWMADAEIVRVYGYTEEEFQAMVDRMPEEFGQNGQDIVDIATAHAAGINHFIAQMQQGRVPQPAGLADIVPPNEIAPWRPTDIVAVISIVRALFGAGGGNELGNAARFARMVEDYGIDDARLVYEDFRNRLNDDGPLHTLEESFQYMLPAMPMPGTEGNVTGFGPGAPGLQGIFEEIATLFPGTAGAAAADLEALAEASRIKWENVVLDTAAGRLDLSKAFQGSMSNWLAVDKDRSATGHPIVIGGPQAGYWDPQILVESELHSPTIHARGAGFPGLSTLVVIGRSHQAVWTATAGGSDMIDTYVEILCDPDGGTVTEEEVHYLHDTDGDGTHECIPMDRRLHRESATLPGGEVLPAIYVERTIHGPVTARGRIGDLPVAVSRKRSTYLKEADPAVSILRMNRGEAETAEDFIDIFGESHTLSTNWVYANADEIAYFHGGLFPIRPDTIHPDLPVWGTGEWEWLQDAEGNDLYLDGRQHPHEANPARGYMVSWNNRQAPNWGEDDSGWGFSALYRADLLEDKILAEPFGSIDPVKLTQIMEEAGLSDLRGTHNLPNVIRILKAKPAPSQREADMLALLEQWVADRALRRDGDLDGEYDNASAVAIMDALWEPLIHAMFDPALGRPVDGVSRQGFHNEPNNAGSAFQGGFYGQVWTDTAMVLGDPVESPTSQVFCGSDELGVDGTLGACSERLWAAMVAAGDALAASQETDVPSEWGVDEGAERIIFLPNGALSMQWVNRPTTQVLAMFGRNSVPAPAPAPSAAPAQDELPSTGGGLGVLGLLTAAGALGLRRRRAA